MITITITKTSLEKFTVNENVITEKIPTDKTQTESSTYSGSSTKTLYHEKYEVRAVEKFRSSETKLLEQNLADDSFDLLAVVKAINGI